MAVPARPERARPGQGDPGRGEPEVTGRAGEGVEGALGREGPPSPRSAKCSATPTRTSRRTPPRTRSGAARRPTPTGAMCQDDRRGARLRAGPFTGAARGGLVFRPGRRRCGPGGIPSRRDGAGGSPRRPGRRAAASRGQGWSFDPVLFATATGLTSQPGREHQEPRVKEGGAGPPGRAAVRAPRSGPGSGGGLRAPRRHEAGVRAGPRLTRRGPGTDVRDLRPVHLPERRRRRPGPCLRFLAIVIDETSDVTGIRAEPVMREFMEEMAALPLPPLHPRS